MLETGREADLETTGSRLGHGRHRSGRARKS
jgi:hypothetical protein